MKKDGMDLISELVSVEKREALKNTAKTQKMTTSKRQEELLKIVLKNTDIGINEDLGNSS